MLQANFERSSDLMDNIVSKFVNDLGQLKDSAIRELVPFQSEEDLKQRGRIVAYLSNPFLLNEWATIESFFWKDYSGKERKIFSIQRKNTKKDIKYRVKREIYGH